MKNDCRAQRFHYSEPAKREAEESLQLLERLDRPYTESSAAVSLALAGDSQRALRIADELARRFPEATSMRAHYLPMIHGAVAIRSGNGSQATEAFAAGALYEIGEPAFMPDLPLYPVYLHGLACLTAHDGAKATEEFQKIIDLRGDVRNEPIGALAHLGLGRAYAMTGEKSKAQTAYQDFLALWKDADVDIPILKQAKSEYAKLK